ncbi:hypothetical protein SYJ56_24215 [Algoriphagus sp. D3-2-R+10]|uniref:hypothetical protein n=1 Tax=Algoriphagus aurantiacus TaxID=3103948 RepID=UPI002B3E339B|nr:hypothetical protein [Algoriphagus sp. D3-2-R+10]MEB2778437.1 hypothetical protein [Algoriphagus sp. D3-2-R+10]
MSSYRNNPNFIFNDYPCVPVTWFPVGNKKLAESRCRKLQEDGVKIVRVGVDYANGISKRNAKWYKWLLSTLNIDFEVEPCFINPESKNSEVIYKPMLVEAIETFVHNYGETFNSVGLWRYEQEQFTTYNVENIYEQDFVFAISWTKHLGKKVNLGGISPSDFNWITRMISCHVFNNVGTIYVEYREEDHCLHNQMFGRILTNIFEAKGFDISIRSLQQTDSTYEMLNPWEAKSASPNTTLKIS